MAVILVGMADLNVAKNPDILTTLGLGSCVGITLYDKIRKIGGMAHIMLPASGENLGHNRAKFADTAFVDLLEKMVRMGANRGGLTAKIAGGAHMFSGSNNNVLKIGERNIAASLELLNKHRIPVLANETGGKHGRTIELHTDTGKLKIKTVGHGEKIV
jgi:chemotaxis protein CheD